MCGNAQLCILKKWGRKEVVIQTILVFGDKIKHVEPYVWNGRRERRREKARVARMYLEFQIFIIIDLCLITDFSPLFRTLINDFISLCCKYLLEIQV